MRQRSTFMQTDPPNYTMGVNAPQHVHFVSQSTRCHRRSLETGNVGAIANRRWRPDQSALETRPVGAIDTSILITRTDYLQLQIRAASEYYFLYI